MKHMKHMKIMIIALSTMTILSACKMTLVPYEIKPGQARLENFTRTTSHTVAIHKEWKENNIDENTHPYTKESLKYLYAMCNNFNPRPYRQAYQHPAGDHKIWVKAIYLDREADALFNIKLKEGGDYGFGHKVYKNRRQVEVWIKDLTTDKPVSEIQIVTLKKFKVEYKKSYDLWQSRCAQGTI